MRYINTITITMSVALRRTVWGDTDRRFYNLRVITWLWRWPAQVVETSVNGTSNSSSQVYTHPDDHNLRTYDTNITVVLL